MATIKVKNDWTTHEIQDFLSWTYSEDITGRDPSAHTGGSGQITFSTPKRFSIGSLTNTITLLNKGVTLTCPQGEVKGTVRNWASGSDNSVQISADDVMLQLKKYVVARAQVNRSLSQIMTYLRGLLGYTITISIEAGLLGYVTTMAGFEGNFYDRFKEFLTAKGLAMQATPTGILITNFLTLPTTEVITEVTDNSLTHTLQDSCRKIEIGYYQHTPISFSQIYPLNYSNEGDSIQVGAGEVVEVVYDVDATLTMVYQPHCVWADDLKGTGQGYDGTSGAYSVIGGDTGTDISPIWWNDNGGLLEVEINPDSTSITVRITAPNSDLYAPYTITADPDMNWTGMYITGTGALHKYVPVTITTGASAEATNEDIGVVVDNPFVSNATEAYNAGYFTAASANLVTERSVNTTREIVDSFGTYLGTQVNYEFSMFRVESITHGSDGLVQLSLTGDTRAKDFDDTFWGTTVEQMGWSWTGFTALDISMAPLKIRRVY